MKTILFVISEKFMSFYQNDKNFCDLKQKSHILETKYLSTDANSSTDTTVGCTNNYQKLNFFLMEKNHPKRKKKSLEICQN